MQPLQEQLQLSREQGNQTHQLALMNMLDSKEERAAQLEYQKLRDRKEDRRYNENLDRLDMKDRRMAISGMTGGLAALAAAFAM